VFTLGGYWLGARRQQSSPELPPKPRPSWLPTATPSQRLSVVPTVTTSQNEKWAIWAADIPSAGQYEVFAFVPDQAEATGITYKVMHRDGVTDVQRDQADHRGQWMSLGTYAFDAHGPATVLLSDSSTGPAGKTVFLDTVKWESPTATSPRPSPPPSSTAVDVMLIINSSSSMTTTDPGNKRIQAALTYLTASVGGDRVGVVDFDHTVRLRVGCAKLG